MNTSMKCRPFLLMSLLFLLGSTFSWADQPASEKRKEIAKTFTVTSSDQLSIENRYGNITITHGGSNEVSIRVVVEAKAKNDTRAQELLDRINIQLEKTGNTVAGITSFAKQNINNGGNNENFSINYFVTMPSAFKSTLEQRYGNINLPESNNGKTSIELKYGNLKAGSFVADLNLDADYSNVDVKDLVNGNIEVSYAGSAKFGNVNTLNIESKYSQLEMKSVKVLNMEGSYSGLKAERIGVANMELKYTDGNIAYLEESLSGSFTYGNLTVKELSADFKSVTVESKYGNLNLGIPAKAAFTVDAENIKYGNVDLSGFNTQVKKEGNAIHTTVNNGSQKRIQFDGGGYGNMKIKAL